MLIFTALHGEGSNIKNCPHESGDTAKELSGINGRDLRFSRAQIMRAGSQRLIEPPLRQLDIKALAGP